MLALAGVYAASVWFGLTLSTVHGNVSPVWPPSGVAIAGLVLLGGRAWPALVLGGGLVILQTPVPLPAGLGLVAANVLEAVTAALLLRRLGFSRELGRLRDVGVLSLIVVPLCALASTVIGVLSLVLAGSADWARLGPMAWTWWVGNAMGALVVTPALLLARAGPMRLRCEAVLLAVLILGVCLGVFHHAPARSSLAYTGIFLLLPLSIWAALRFGPRGAALATLVIAAATIAGTSLGRGPFTFWARVDNLLVMQLFVGVIALTGQLLAAVTTERQRAMEELKLAGATLRAVREGVLISELREDGALRIVHANEAFLDMLGRTREELLGRSPRTLTSPDGLSGDTEARLDEAIARRAVFRGEVGLMHASGQRVSSEVQLSWVRDEHGEVTHAVSTHRDVSETKELQAKLLAAERYAVMGTLAAGVGHEINNPLAYFALSLEAAERGLERGDAAGVAEALGNLRGAREGAERIRLIVRDLKTFSREVGDERTLLDLREVVAPALRMTRHALSGRARLVEDYGQVPKVEGSEARLGQVLLNLLVNAVQAIPEGHPELHEVRVRTGTDEAGRAFVEVSDTGQGIPAHVLPRIFDPFFTTKADAEGTGLGLSICREIVRAHGGEVRVRSEEGRGATFTVVLPPASVRAESEASEDSDGAPMVSVRAEGEALLCPGDARRGRILIIDDEPRLAQSMRLLLEPSHDVVTTTRGCEALALVSSGQRFDLVLCDLQMPETSGMDVYARLQADAPELLRRVVFLSGGAYTPAAREFIRSVSNPVLEKPVRPEALLAVVDAALAREAGARD